MAFVAISVASCTKNYTCQCTDATGGEVKTFKNVTQQQAESNCRSKKVTEAGTVSTENCTLK